jgi:hypothetical protein
VRVSQVSHLFEVAVHDQKMRNSEEDRKPPKKKPPFPTQEERRAMNPRGQQSLEDRKGQKLGAD